MSASNDQGTQDESRTKRSELTDDSGAVRAKLNTDSDGEPGILLYDRSGRLRLSAGLSEDDSGFIFYDQNGRCRLTAYLSEDGYSYGLQFYDQNDRHHLGLDLWGYMSTPSLYLEDPHEQLERVPHAWPRDDDEDDEDIEEKEEVSHTDGLPEVCVYDQNDRIRLSAAIPYKDGSPLLQVWDQDSRLRMETVLSEDGLTDLTLYDPAKDICYLASVYEDEAAVLTLIDSGEEIRGL